MFSGINYWEDNTMNKKLILARIMIVFIFVSCGHLSMIEENYVPPVQKNQPRLLYPRSAQENSNTGNSIVKFTISKSGQVEDVEIMQTSGLKILDDAAAEYCRSLVFDPAKRNGEDVYSIMKLTVKFDVTDTKFDQMAYVEELKKLYKISGKLDSSAKVHTLKEILNLHNEFVLNMKDALNFNFYVGQVILPRLEKDWQKDWNSWPLSFLLYHDFMLRFPEYDSLSLVKAQMVNSLKFDLNYIENSTCKDAKEKAGKNLILNKISAFISEHYPDIVIENFATGINRGSKPIS
jgi:TonB family protein